MCNCDCFLFSVFRLHLSMLHLICHFYYPVIHNCMTLLRHFVASLNFALSAGCRYLPISPFPHYLWVVWIALCTARMPEKLCGKSSTYFFATLISYFCLFLPENVMLQICETATPLLLSLRAFVKVTYKRLLEIKQSMSSQSILSKRCNRTWTNFGSWLPPVKPVLDLSQGVNVYRSILNWFLSVCLVRKSMLLCNPFHHLTQSSLLQIMG